MRDAYEIITGKQLDLIVSGFLDGAALFRGERRLDPKGKMPDWTTSSRVVAMGWVSDWLRRVPEALWTKLLRAAAAKAAKRIDRLELIGCGILVATLKRAGVFGSLPGLAEADCKVLRDAAEAVIPPITARPSPTGEMEFL